MGCLYLLDFASGKRYVGITTTSLVTRVGCHRTAARNGSKQLVHVAWRKHGEPKTRVLAYADGDYLLELERGAVAAYGTHGGGYNLTSGGDRVPEMTPERRAKIGAASRGRRHRPESIERMVGRPVSAETREKIAATKRGKPRPQHVRDALRRAALGRIVSAETRERQSLAHKALPPRSPEWCANISASKRRAFAAKAL